MLINFENSIVICDQAYFNIFYSLKEKDPFLDIKLMDKKEVVSLLEFEVNNEFIKYLLFNIEDLDYLNARKLAYILQYADESKYKYKEELLKEGVIKKDPLKEEVFKNKSVYLFENDLDKELKELLKRHNINYEEIGFDSIGFKPNQDLLTNTRNKPTFYKAYLFKNYDDEFMYVFSSIYSLLVKKEVSPKDIYIYIDGDFSFYLNYYLSLFNLKSDIETKTTLISYPKVRMHLEKFYKNKKIENIIGDELSFEENELNDAINFYDLENMNFKKGYMILEEILSSVSYKKSIYGGIRIVDKPIFKNNIYLFTLTFQADTFYKVYKDDNVIFDNKLKEYSVNTSYEKTELSKKLMKNFLLFQNHVLLGKVKEHLQDKIYDSEFVEEYKITYNEALKEDEDKNKKDDKNKCYKYGKNNLFNKASSNIFSAKLKDDWAFKKDENYKSYDNSFKKFKPKIDVIKNNFSATKFEAFANCPFSYYLERVLLLKVESDDFYMSLGTFVHDILEHSKDEGFDYDSYFDEHLKSNDSFSDEQKTTISLTVKKPFKVLLVDFYGKFNEILRNYKYEEFKEKSLSFTYKENGVENNIQGQLDLIIRNKETGNAIIIDYKSGKTEFEPNDVIYGLSIQLPLYYLLLKNSNLGVEDVDGIYLSHVLYPFSKGYDKDSNLLLKSEYLKNFRPEGMDQFERELNKYGKPIIKDNPTDLKDLLDNKNYNYDFNKLISTTEETIKEIVNKIENFEFEIIPVTNGASYNEKKACNNCSYRAICYRENSNFKFIGEGGESDE